MKRRASFFFLGLQPLRSQTPFETVKELEFRKATLFPGARSTGSDRLRRPRPDLARWTSSFIAAGLHGNGGVGIPGWDARAPGSRPTSATARGLAPLHHRLFFMTGNGNGNAPPAAIAVSFLCCLWTPRRGC